MGTDFMEQEIEAAAKTNALRDAMGRVDTPAQEVNPYAPKRPRLPVVNTMPTAEEINEYVKALQAITALTQGGHRKQLQALFNVVSSSLEALG